MRLFRSLFSRILAGTVLAVVLALAVVAVALPQMVERFLLTAKEWELMERALQTREIVASYLAGELPEAQAQAFLEALGASGDTEAWIVNRLRVIVLDSSREDAPVPEPGEGVSVTPLAPAPCVPSGPYGQQGQYGLHGQGSGAGAGRGFGRGWRVRGYRLESQDAVAVLSGQPWVATGTRWPYPDPVVSVGVPVASPDGSEIIGAIFLHSPVSGVAQTAAQLRRYLLVAAGVGLLAAFGAAIILSRNVTRPVREMSEMAVRIARGDLDVRAPTGGPGEIGELGRSLNAMAAALAASREESRRLETMRRDLVANVSHDLRSPITAIRGFVEPLLDGTVTDEETRRRYLSTIRAETDALSVLVADLLELSRLEVGAAALKLGPVDVGQLAREAAARYAVRAEEAGVALQTEVEEGLPPLEADEARVARAISNLLDNALKFSPRGGEVRLGVRSERPRHEVLISVRDSGPGIAPSDLPHVWERFYKADPSRHRTQADEGSGLGLAIVKEVAEAHGGRAEVSSEPGRGSEFRIFLPVRDPPVRDG